MVILVGHSSGSFALSDIYYINSRTVTARLNLDNIKFESSLRGSAAGFEDDDDEEDEELPVCLFVNSPLFVILVGRSSSSIVSFGDYLVVRICSQDKP